MIGQLINNPIAFVFWIIALVVAISIHEFSHAFMADYLGDPTPRLQGRLTLNPLAHLDPIGTILLLIARFGWGKPVIFDPYNLRNPKRDSALISIAGPISNFLLASVCAIIVHFLMNINSTAVDVLIALLQSIIVLSVMLGVFNLVPIHPLDGFKIVEGILPDEYARQWHELQPYGLIFLLFLAFPILGNVAPLTRVISPVINGILGILLPGTSLF
ncbi:MAG TPA: site-2 protease family protein [Patescibacteria group bacterium]|nr:site-2 protease family protein [Patescibacteria group bacterium]